MREAPMHFFNQAVAQLAQDMKARTWESICDHKLTQMDIAVALGVDQSTISRWMNPAGDLHLPAFTIPALSDEKVIPLRADLLTFIGIRSGYVVTERPKIIGELNGSLDDETMELAAYVGRIAEQVASGRMDAKRARRDIALMRKALDRAEAELEGSRAAG